MGKLQILKIIEVNDEIIKNETDELYDLQQKYNIKISRSNSSDAVYIFRNQSFRVRVGHFIPKHQNHLNNFRYNIQVNNVTKSIVEKVIQKYFM